MSPRDGGNKPCDPLRPQSPHAMLPVSLADGSVQIIHSGLDPTLWRQLLKPCDGGPVDGSW